MRPAQSSTGFALGLSVLLCSVGTSLAEEPDWGDSTPAQVCFWILVFVATPFAVASLVIFILGLLDLLAVVRPPSCCAHSTYYWLNLVVLGLWPFVLALSIYLLVADLTVAATYLGWAILALLLHTLLLVLYVKQARRTAQENPRQQLLTAQKYSDKNPVPDATAARDVNTGGSDSAGGPNDATKGAAAAALAAISAHPSNPFPATYGLLPGTSQYGYQIFIPMEAPEAQPSFGSPQSKESFRAHRHSRGRSHDTDQTRTRTIRV